jgi:hypothetical protein
MVIAKKGNDHHIVIGYPDELSDISDIFRYLNNPNKLFVYSNKNK